MYRNNRGWFPQGHRPRPQPQHRHKGARAALHVQGQAVQAERAPQARSKEEIAKEALRAHFSPCSHIRTPRAAHPMSSLHRHIFEKAQSLQEGQQVDETITFREGRVQVWQGAACLDISRDGSTAVRSGDTCTVPLLCLYKAVQLLQIHYGRSIPRTDAIDAVVPPGLRGLFWQGECTEEDLAGIDAVFVHRPEEAHPGVFLSFNMFGTTLSFMDAYNELLTDDNLPADPRFPVCAIKTPDGFMVSEDTFQIDECWSCQSFLSKLHHLMLESCRDRAPGEKYTWRRSPAQVRILGAAQGSRAQVMYTSMSDIALDRSDMTFDVTWRAMASY